MVSPLLPLTALNKFLLSCDIHHKFYETFIITLSQCINQVSYHQDTILDIYNLREKRFNLAYILKGLIPCTRQKHHGTRAWWYKAS